VLDVDGGDDVDASFEDLVDVLVALLVAHARRIGVRELVDERQLGRALDHGVDVHLLELEPAVFCAQTRHDLDPLRKDRGLRAVMRLEVADHDVAAGGLRLLSFLEHAVSSRAGAHRASPNPRGRSQTRS
jgi:hypothetical protein